jgi:hypothetical protein
MWRRDGVVEAGRERRWPAAGFGASVPEVVGWPAMPVTTRATIRTARRHSSWRRNGSSGTGAVSSRREPMRPL